MSKTVTALFACTAASPSHYEDGTFGQVDVLLAPVTEDSHPDESAFWESTPSGELNMQITNESAAAFFEQGADYDVTFTRRGEDAATVESVNEPTRHYSVNAIFRFFAYEHLPEPLRGTSKHFHDLAQVLMNDINLGGPELTVALRKLLEAKDCAVRAGI